MPAKSADVAWSLDREIVLSRVFDAPRELVFKAWTDPAHVTKWFCPKGFTTTTQEIDLRVGGRWRVMMIGPDGTHFGIPTPGMLASAPHAHGTREKEADCSRSAHSRSARRG